MVWKINVFLSPTCQSCKQHKWSDGRCHIDPDLPLLLSPRHTENAPAQDSVHRAKAEEYYKDLSEAILSYQTEKGLWRQEMTESASWEESSGTALLLYGMGMGLRKAASGTSMHGSHFRISVSVGFHQGKHKCAKGMMFVPDRLFFDNISLYRPFFLLPS